MQLAVIDKVLWAYGFIQNLFLLVVLLWRGRARSFPFFTVLIAFGTLRTLVLFAVFALVGRHHTYALVYWYAAGVDLLLQVAVVYEIAKNALYRSSEWVPGAKYRFYLLASTAPIVGMAFAWTMKPAARNALDAWDARANLFITVTICLMVSAVMTISKQLGVGWSRSLLRFGAGLAVWSVTSFVTGTLHAYWRTVDRFSLLENCMSSIYLLVTLYWIVIFWSPELEPVTPSEADLQRRNQFIQAARRLREH